MVCFFFFGYIYSRCVSVSSPFCFSLFLACNRGHTFFLGIKVSWGRVRLWAMSFIERQRVRKKKVWIVRNQRATENEQTEDAWWLYKFLGIERSDTYPMCDEETSSVTSLPFRSYFRATILSPST